MDQRRNVLLFFSLFEHILGLGGQNFSEVLQCFSSSSLRLNRSIILPFSGHMEKEPRYHLFQNCLHSTFAVEQLPIHFLRVSCTEKRNVEKSSIIVSVSGAFLINNLPNSLR